MLFRSDLSAQIHQMLKTVDDPLQVTDAVAIRIFETARIDLVDDAALPPAQAVRGGHIVNFLAAAGCGGIQNVQVQICIVIAIGTSCEGHSDFEGDALRGMVVGVDQRDDARQL